MRKWVWAVAMAAAVTVRAQGAPPAAIVSWSETNSVEVVKAQADETQTRVARLEKTVEEIGKKLGQRTVGGRSPGDSIEDQLADLERRLKRIERDIDDLERRVKRTERR